MRKTRKSEVTLMVCFCMMFAVMSACGKKETISTVGSETVSQTVSQVSENTGEAIGTAANNAVETITDTGNEELPIVEVSGEMGKAMGIAAKDAAEGIMSAITSGETSNASYEGNVIGGLDFTEFRNGNAPLEKIMADATYDSPKLIVMDYTVSRKVECILSNGGHRELMNNMPEAVPKVYEFAIYVPKRATDIKTITPTDIIRDPRETISYDENGNPYDDVLFWFELPCESIESEFEASFQIYYEDGTEDTFTVYLTKNFVTGD